MEFIGTVWNCLQNIDKYTPDSAVWVNPLLLQNQAFWSAWQGYRAYKDTQIEHENTMCDSNFNYSKALLSPGLEFAFRDCKLRWVTRLCLRPVPGTVTLPAGSRPKATWLLPASARAPFPSAHLGEHGKPFPQQHVQCSPLEEAISLAWELPFLWKNMVSSHFCYWWVIISQQTRTRNWAFS